MFSFFKKKKINVFVTDFIWVSEQGKINGLKKSLTDALSKNQRIGIFYYFDTIPDWIKSVVETSNLTEKQLASIEFFSANDLANSTRNSSELKRLLNSENYKLFFTEHYPIHSTEERVFEHLYQLSGKQEKLDYHISLKDPLMVIFDSEKIIQLMHRMGYKDDEITSHSMISKSIVNAQKKVEKNCTNELRASSSAEWFQFNYPHL